MAIHKRQQSITEFPLPDTCELESIVLASIVANGSSIYDAKTVLNESDFSEKTVDIWRALVTMADKREEIDLVSVSTRISKAAFQNIILPAKPEYLHFEQTMDLLKEASLKRRAYFTAIDLLRKAVTPGSSMEDIMTDATIFIEGVSKDTKSKRSQSLREAIGALQEKLLDNDYRVPTGIVNLDKLTYGGFNEGNLVILAARPSVGKTAMALYMMRRAAEQGKRVFMASLEMTNIELAQRYMFSTEYVKPLEFATRQVNWVNFQTANKMLAGLPIFINDECRTLDEICAEIKRQKRDNKIDIAYVDYLGLIRTNVIPGELQAQTIGRITGRLKELAKELHIPIVLLCQLNRGSAIDARTPQLFDLRNSGEIEQDADIVLMLSKPQSQQQVVTNIADESGQSMEDNRLDMWLRKNRNGRRDIGISMEHNPTHTLYYETGLIKE